MQIMNQFGSRFKGTLGKAMTAGTWKGRNYIRGYRKPHITHLPSQVEQRARFEDSVAEWHGLNLEQKLAYGHTRAVKTLDITNFNGLIKVWVDTSVAGEEYEPPAFGYVEVRDSVTHDPLATHFIVYYAEGGVSVISSRTYDDGKSEKVSFVIEEEPYRLDIVKPGYKRYAVMSITAAEVLAMHDLIAV